VLPTIPSSQQLTTSYQQRRNNAEPTADKKYYERQIGELNKKVKQLSMESDQLRKRCDVMTSKYENIKKIGNKDKFIGLSSEDLKITTLKERRTERQSLTPSSSTTLAHLNNSSILLDEVTDMWSGLQNNTSMTNLSRFKQYSMEERRVHTEAEEIKEEANKWECIANF
jgi:phage shock protein A